MKITKLTIDNIGKIEHTEIECNHPLLMFYGEVMQGKTTVLNAVRWTFGGSFPQDIIRHGATEASVTLTLDNGSISREWYRAKDGSTKARKISFVMNGIPVKEPTREIEKFLNPFLLDQDFLRKMGETERKTYFTTLFSVDTSELDKQIFTASEEAKGLREKLKGYGDIDTTEVKPIDVEKIKAELKEKRAEAQAQINAVQNENNRVVQQNFQINSAGSRIVLLSQDRQRLQRELDQIDLDLQTIKTWLKEHPLLVVIPVPTMPDFSELEVKVNEAAANEVRVQQYKKNLERAKLRDTDNTKLVKLEGDQRELKAKKISALSKINETCAIKDLSFDDTGNFTFQGTTAGMLSGAQIMQLSAELSRLYPEGLGVGLIDRGESLGKSIFGLIDIAKARDETILVTVVGEAPAETPENVGVFVVEGGQVNMSETSQRSVASAVALTDVPALPSPSDVWND